MITKIFRLVGFMALLLSLGSCPNPAAPPSPPAELPSFLRFPGGVTIDVDKISTQRSVPASGAFKALVGIGGEFSKEIAFGADLSKVNTDFVGNALSFMSAFEIPVNSTTITFEGITNLEDGTGSDIKIDFGNFDLDQDGVREGCSGHTAALPVCFRIWVDGERTLAGRFDAFPSDGNPGAGRFRATASGETGVIDAAAIYDFQDPLARSVETFLLVESVDQPPAFGVHSFVSQSGPDATAKKRLLTSVEDRGLICDFSEDFTSCGTDLNTVRYAGQWREDNDYWSGSLENTFGTLQNFTDLCAQISNGDQSPAGNCSDLGIDVSSVDFIGFTNESDVSFPPVSEFPEAPTF